MRLLAPLLAVVLLLSLVGGAAAAKPTTDEITFMELNCEPETTEAGTGFTGDEPMAGRDARPSVQITGA